MIAAVLLLAAGPGVALSFDGCPADLEVALRRIAGIELGELLNESADDRVQVRCDGSAVHLAATRSGRTPAGPFPARLERTVALGDWPADARPRVVGLAAVELAAALNPVVRSRLDDHAPEVSSSDGDAGFQILAGAVWRRFLTSGGLGALGATLALEQGSRAGPGAALDLDLGGATGVDRLGTVSALIGSGGVAVLAGREWGDWGGRLRLGFRLGFARMAGHAADPAVVMARQVLRPWAGPTLSGAVDWSHRWLCVRLGAELGYAAVGARALGAGTAAAAAGPWVALTLTSGVSVSRSSRGRH
jgi:hypothetical protein